MHEPHKDGLPDQVELFDLPKEQRNLESARLINQMRMSSLGARTDQPWPVELQGNRFQAQALLDLLIETTPEGRIGVIITTIKTTFKADTRTVSKLNQNGGIIPITFRSGNTTVLRIEELDNGIFSCKFGYSAKGTIIERGVNGAVNVTTNNDIDIIAGESLYRLYRLTGNPNLIEALGVTADLRGSGAKSAKTVPIDPAGHYATLGLNPYVLRFMDANFLSALVAGMKRECARKMHPDLNKPSARELEYLSRVLSACEVLSDAQKRNDYSNWLGL